MKKLFVLLALGVAGAACQHQAPSASATTHSVVPIQGSAKLPKVTFSQAVAADTLSKRMLFLLCRYDLAFLWNDPHGTYQESPVLDGFIGKEHQRLGLFIKTVQRDSKRQQVLLVTGKSRLNRITTPFEGTIVIDKIRDLQDNMVGPGESADSTNSLYTASGTFHFKQLAAKQAGEFLGNVFFDFVITGEGKVDMITTIMTNPDDKFPAKGCGLVLRGSWLNLATQQRKPVLLARDVFVIAPEIFTDFGIGDRGTLANPKYAHLGWNEAWENDEWWADSPKPALTL